MEFILDKMAIDRFSFSTTDTLCHHSSKAPYSFFYHRHWQRTQLLTKHVDPKIPEKFRLLFRARSFYVPDEIIFCSVSSSIVSQLYLLSISFQLVARKISLQDCKRIKLTRRLFRAAYGTTRGFVLQIMRHVNLFYANPSGRAV